MSGNPPTDLVDQKFHDALMDPNTPWEECERLVEELGSLENMDIAIKAYAEVEETKAPKPGTTDDVYVVERGHATLEQYNEAVEIVKREHEKKEGIVVMDIYPNGGGFVQVELVLRMTNYLIQSRYYCPKDMDLIDPKAKRFKDLFIAKNLELRQQNSAGE